MGSIRTALPSKARGKRTIAEDQLTPERAEELAKCFKNHIYFIGNYCKIYDSVLSDWIDFELWDAQKKLLNDIHNNQLTVILKARQLGISWLSLSYALWQIIFRPIAAVSLFSRRDNESLYMLSNDRLRGMFSHLPAWMKAGHDATVDSGHEWILSNGSAVRAFPTSAGDGYVSTLAIVDEADLSPDLNKLMRSVKPTIDNGGKLVLLSRVDKSEPESEFKRIYKGAKAGGNGWHHLFLPWYAHPGRDAAWYEMQKKDILSRTGSLDDLYEQYPATDGEALAERSLDKRIPPQWINACYREMKGLVFGTRTTIPHLPGLQVFFEPMPGTKYIIGADPAEGNPTSDDSSLTICIVDTGEEVATLSGKVEPTIFSTYIMQLSAYYNGAPAQIERNNHGHAVIQWLEEHAKTVRLLPGHDAEPRKKLVKGQRKRKVKAGWLTSTLGKSILYTICTEHFRISASLTDPSKTKVVVHSEHTYSQLCSIEGASLEAPEGRHDDRAVSYALCQAGRVQLKNLGHTGGLVMAATKGWGF